LAPNPFRLTARIFFQLNTCGHSPYGTSSLTRGWVCRLQLPLVLASTVLLRSESRGTHDHIFLSQVRGSPNLECQVPVFIFPRNRVVQLYPRHWIPFSSPPTTRRDTVEVFDPPPHGGLTTESGRVLCYDRRSVRQSAWNKAQIWCLTRFLLLSVAGLLIWGALSDLRVGLSFKIAIGLRLFSHTRVRFPYDSGSYLTVSDSRLLFSSPPKTRKATVEVVDPASTRDVISNKFESSQVLCYDRRSVGQSVLE
jgi:hypothetical protein